MTEEVQALAEVDSALAPEVTATTDTATNAPEVAETQNEQKPEEAKFTQAEIDAMISKRLAREQRKWEREQSQRRAESQTLSAPAAASDIDPSVDPEAYAQAVALQKAEQLIAQREAAKQQNEVLESYYEREEQIRDRYDDFDQVVKNPNLRITDVMAETIYSSDIGPEVAYHLGTNPKEAERIAKLSPYLQAKEIGKIEAKLAADPPAKKTSSAPEPIRPVTARATNSGVTDTTDPRSVKTMSDSEWIEAERRRQIAKQQALRNR